MAVRLRLRREGTKKQPHFRVVAADRRSPRDGRFIEIIGEYHPAEDPSRIEIDDERALYWLHQGAQPSNTVEKLLRIAGVWEQFKPGDEPARVREPARPKASKKQRARGDEAETSAPSAPEEVAEGPPEDATAEPVAETQPEPEAAGSPGEGEDEEASK